MAVTVTIESGNKQVRITTDSGFDESVRIARAIRQAVQMIDGSLPPANMSLTSLLILELGGKLRSESCTPKT